MFLCAFFVFLLFYFFHCTFLSPSLDRIRNDFSHVYKISILNPLPVFPFLSFSPFFFQFRTQQLSLTTAELPHLSLSRTPKKQTPTTLPRASMCHYTLVTFLCMHRLPVRRAWCRFCLENPGVVCNGEELSYVSHYCFFLHCGPCQRRMGMVVSRWAS